MELLGPEGFDILHSKGVINIASYNVQIPLLVYTWSSPKIIAVRAKEHTIISPFTSHHIVHIEPLNAIDTM